MTEIPLRKHADWMSKNDDRILEYLARAGPSRPVGVQEALADAGDALDLRVAYLDRRLELLARAGLLDHAVAGNRYELTERGLAYLRGEVDASRVPTERGPDGTLVVLDDPDDDAMVF